MKWSITSLVTLFAALSWTTEARIGRQNYPRRRLSELRLRPETEEFAKLHHLGDTEWRKAVIRNAHNGDASCNDPSKDFIRPLARGIGREKLEIMFDNDLDMIPMYYSLLRDQSPLEYFGDNGEETREVKAAHEDCIDFWGRANLPTDNISLLGMHGSFMKDTDRLVPTLKAMYNIAGTGYSTYLELALDIQEFMESIPFQYDNPLLTFNAVAFSDDGKNERIVVGDGLLAYMHHKNVGEEGPEYVLAHEFGHQIQYESGLIMMGHDTDEEETAEESRYTELMADALAGYFLAHDGGGRMDGESIAEVYEAAFTVGDCSVDDEGHHGTPAQRECALIWGANLGASNGDGVLHPSEFATLWERDIAKIVSLDAETCRKPGASLITSAGYVLPPIHLFKISAERPSGRGR